MNWNNYLNSFNKESFFDKWDNIIKMFQISLENWFEVEYILLKHLRLQPSELDKMEFYRAELLIENFKKYSEKEKEAQKEQEKEYNQKFSDLKSGIKMPSIPSLGSFKMPKI
jgi:hypothetical protein